MRRRSALTAGAGAALALLAGCSGGNQPVTRSTAAPASPDDRPPPPSSTVDSDDLARRRVEAGIADCPRSDPEVPAQPDGLPDVTLPCLGGGEQVRLAGLRGTPLVVNVWAQWCGPCRTEAPHLAAVSQQLDGRVAFLGIDYIDPRPELAIEFAAQADWHYPQVTDELGEVRAPLNVLGPPMTVFVDADGHIVHKHPGMITSADQLESMIAEHLGVR